MTDKEKLHKLFEAALKTPEDFSGVKLARAYPVSSLDAATVPVSVPTTAGPEIASPAVCVAPLEIEAPAEATPSTMAGVLDDTASAELAVLLDDQHKRKARRHRMEALVTAVVLLGLTGGGSAWFVQSPARVQAFQEAVRDIRSAGDVKSLVAKYQAALDRVSARSKQIDNATAAMGVKKSAADEKDSYMNAEMKEMMGGEGKTVGERNQALQQNFGHMAKEAGVDIKTTVALKEGESFDWNR
jgi:hypothetical protein